jgi:hypothetical protein
MNAFRIIRPASQILRASRAPLISSTIGYSLFSSSTTASDKMTLTTEELHKKYERHPKPPLGPDGKASYAPDPSKSIPIPPERQSIVDTITRLYSCKATEEDFKVYDEKAIYDDPLSYCDTREKIAAQWVGE